MQQAENAAALHPPPQPFPRPGLLPLLAVNFNQPMEIGDIHTQNPAPAQSDAPATVSASSESHSDAAGAPTLNPVPTATTSSSEAHSDRAGAPTLNAAPTATTSSSASHSDVASAPTLNTALTATTSSELQESDAAEQGNHEEKVNIKDWFEPEVPGPQESISNADAEGWSMIDALGAWDCTLSRFSAIEEIPAQHREIWANAVRRILEKIDEARAGSLEMDRALKWWLFLPQALCRQAGRGGRAGVGQVRKRFDCVVRGDYGTLVELWQKDHESAEARSSRRAQSRASKPPDPANKTRQAVSLISKGFISKATNRLTSHGVAPPDDPRTIEALRAKYPERGKEIQENVTKGRAVESLGRLREAYLALPAGIAPGTGQMRPEFLKTIGEVWEEGSAAWDLLESFGLKYVNAQLPPWFYKYAMTVQTVGLYKTEERDPDIIRPVGMKNPVFGTLHKEVIMQNKSTIVEHLEPQQLGMSVGGGAKLVHSVRMTLESNPEFIAVKCDIKNAFNDMSRARMVHSLEIEPELRHLALHAATVLAPRNGLESGGKLWGEASEGGTQGDPESGPYFCIGIQEMVVEADSRVNAHGGIARFGWDDGYLVGLPEDVYPALETFTERVKSECGLVLQRAKTEVYCRDEKDLQPGLKRAGEMIEGVWQSGMICYGVPIGSDQYVRHLLDIKVNELEGQAAVISKVLGDERQAMWAVLRSSVAHKLDYWCTLVYPSLMEGAAQRMDKIMLDMLDGLVCSKIPLHDEGLGYECPLNVPVENLQGRSFQNLVIRQPIKMGGLGVRSVAETCQAAYIGGLEQSLPHFTGPDGVCQVLTPIIGDNWQSDTRWAPLLASACRTGEELQAAWESLKLESNQCAAYLGDEPSGALALPVEGVGDGATDGSTRRKVVQQREEQRGAVMKEALARNPDQRQQQVLCWNNRDKLATAWLQSLPGPHGMSSLVFTEALARALCLPSPACKERIGMKIGKSVVDAYGDSVMSSVLPGDHWRTRHDQIKMVISSLCTWARVPVTTEVFGLFSHLIPAQALTRFERGRKRQGLVPDFRLELPTLEGNTGLLLAELKLISCCKTWYSPSAGGNIKATEKRAAGLQADYRRKARDADKETRERTGDQRGPVERRLEEFGDLIGLVFGAWGEASEGVHRLIQAMAEARMRYQSLQSGKPGSAAELGVIVGQIRRKLSLAAVKAQTECLLAKLHQVGPGTAAMNKRRQWAAQEDERMRREREAQWLRRTEGIYTMRKGAIRTA